MTIAYLLSPPDYFVAIPAVKVFNMVCDKIQLIERINLLSAEVYWKNEHLGNPADNDFERVLFLGILQTAQPATYSISR